MACHIIPTSYLFLYCTLQSKIDVQCEDVYYGFYFYQNISDWSVQYSLASDRGRKYICLLSSIFLLFIHQKGFVLSSNSIM